VAERRSLELHRLVAERLRADPSLLERARDRVEAWLREGPVHPRWAEGWRRLLEQPLDDLLRVLVDPGPEAHDLRQSPPFAGVLDARTRWAALRRLGTGRP
jgi:hypothetical protein